MLFVSKLNTLHKSAIDWPAGMSNKLIDWFVSKLCSRSVEFTHCAFTRFSDSLVQQYKQKCFSRLWNQWNVRYALILLCLRLFYAPWDTSYVLPVGPKWSTVVSVVQTLRKPGTLPLRTSWRQWWPSVVMQLVLKFLKYWKFESTWRNVHTGKS